MREYVVHRRRKRGARKNQYKVKSKESGVERSEKRLDNGRNHSADQQVAPKLCALSRNYYMEKGSSAAEKPSKKVVKMTMVA